MDRCVAVDAPAKVNLHLEVLAARLDGYHDILSLFQAVSLADRIVVRRAGPAGRFSLRGAFDLPVADNLVTRAVEAFRAETGARDGLVVEVEKRVPAGAGFGGGSSDAAATLRALEALFGVRPTAARRRALAGSLGSDVPFFLEAACALVEGRGDRVQPLAPRTDFALVAVLPGLVVRTAEAFRWIDEERLRCGAGEGRAFPGGRISRADLLAAWEGSRPEGWRFENDFDSVVLARLPGLRALRDGLIAAGASAARLTGSGSALIGVCRSPGEASACARSLLALVPEGSAAPRVEVLAPLASLPGICYN